MQFQELLIIFFVSLKPINGCWDQNNNFLKEKIAPKKKYPSHIYFLFVHFLRENILEVDG